MNQNTSPSGEMPAGRMEEQPTAAAAAAGEMPGFEMPQGGAFPPGTKVEPEIAGESLLQQMVAQPQAAQQAAVEPEMQAYLRSIQAQQGAGEMPGAAADMASGPGSGEMPTRGMNDPSSASSP